MNNIIKTVKIELIKEIDNSYPIIISSGINIALEIKNLGLNNNYAIITDDHVAKLYKEKISSNFLQGDINFKFVIFKQGEKNKNLKVFKNLSEKLLQLGFDRKSTIIALGGGVVGDIAGYIAGTFMRGIPFIQVPTTLLAQVDSSIGGKVAVDLKYGKNSTGLFNQPKKVIIDVDFLKTLSTEEFNNGMMEIIKHGVIRNKEYFEYIEANIEKIKILYPEVIIKLIHESCLIKGKIVQEDEKENDLRRILNFGHTFAHALESISNYQLKHGLAVGIGMIKEAEIAFKLGYLSNEHFKRIITLIKAFGIKPVKNKYYKLINFIKNDKKNMKLNSNLELIIPIILPVKIGKVIIKNFSITDLTNII